MRLQYFTGANLANYENNAYYYINGVPYGKLPMNKSGPYPGTSKSYFDFLLADRSWTFTYAMNWISQINLFHHYIGTRVMYITGSTGTGKSTQVPKLLMYSQRMLDYNIRGKIICTEPRVSPTIENAETIARQLGVPIRQYNRTYDRDVFTGDYYVQYKYQSDAHSDDTTPSFLRIVTDGTLFNALVTSPFITKSDVDTAATDLSGKPLHGSEHIHQEMISIL